MLKTQQVRFSYGGGTAFAFPDIVCQPGEVLLVTGASGKGKTTLLHLMGGLLRPSAGSICVDTIDITQLSPPRLDRFRGGHIGLVFQRPHFVASLTARQNLLLAAHLSGQSQGPQRAAALMEQLGIADQAHKKPAHLSQGQLQRLSIARALMAGPALVLADEPTANLDDENCGQVAALLRQQALQNKAALVIVTHDQRLKSIFHHSVALT
jgi:ABC-type lipoprotein export system ATPase subunit